MKNPFLPLAAAIVLVASPALAQVSLTASGACPGPITASVSGATPFGPVALAWSFTTGTSAVPAGPCGIVTVGLSNPTLLTILVADGAGNASVTQNAPAAACSAFLQAYDLGSCSASNVAPVVAQPGTTYVFPSAGSTVVGSVGFIAGTDFCGYFWSNVRGDLVSESFAGPATISGYSIDIDVLNNLNGGAQCDWEVVINGTVVDTFSVVIGQVLVSESGTFAPIAGPNYNVVLRVTNLVFGGGGSNAFRYQGLGNNQLTLN